MKRIKPTISQRAVAICQRCSDFIITSKVQFSHCVSAMNIAEGDFKAGYIKYFLGKDPQLYAMNHLLCYVWFHCTILILTIPWIINEYVSQLGKITKMPAST